MATTLVTFMVNIPQPISTLRLLGSWDNFSESYPMQRDTRSGGGHWRGCHSFSNIICDGSTVGHGKARSGGLLEGGQYWYYVSNAVASNMQLMRQYQIDGDVDFCDPMKPITNDCPLLPGQQVNVLDVPTQEITMHARKNSMLGGYQFTLDPNDKFRNPTSPTIVASDPEEQAVVQEERSFHAGSVGSPQACPPALGTHDSSTKPALRPQPSTAPSSPISKLFLPMSPPGLQRQKTKSLAALRTFSTEYIPLRAVRSAGHSSLGDLDILIGISHIDDEHILKSHRRGSHVTRACSEFMQAPADRAQTSSPEEFPGVHAPLEPLNLDGTSKSWFLDDDSDHASEVDSYAIDRSLSEATRKEMAREYGEAMDSSLDLDEYYLDRHDLESPLTSTANRVAGPASFFLDPDTAATTSHRTSDLFSSAASCTTGATLSPSNISQPLTPLVNELVEFYLDAAADVDHACFDGAAVDEPSTPVRAERKTTPHLRPVATPLTLTLPPPRTRLARTEAQTSGQALVEAWNDGAAERKTNLQELIDDMGYLGDVIV